MRRARSKLQVSTFPFLAVLLAAMGALILLLLVMDRRAKIVARNKVQETIEARKRDQTEKEAERLAAWQREQEEYRREEEAFFKRLAEQDRSLREELERRRAEVNVAGASLRGIENKLKLEEQEALRLVREQEALRKWLTDSGAAVEARRVAGKLTQQQQDQAERTLAKMTAELARMEKILNDLRSRPKRDNVYSLVPYRGKHGSDSKPIYVECNAGDVIFQPQGRRLLSSELERDRIREEMKRCGVEIGLKKPAAEDVRPASATEKKDPYLLCLVRPAGVETYGQLLRALQGCAIDFGYELIDADWELDFSSEKLAGADAPDEKRVIPRVALGTPGPGGGGPTGLPVPPVAGGAGKPGSGAPGTGEAKGSGPFAGLPGGPVPGSLLPGTPGGSPIPSNPVPVKGGVRPGKGDSAGGVPPPTGAAPPKAGELTRQDGPKALTPQKGPFPGKEGGPGDVAWRGSGTGDKDGTPGGKGAGVPGDTERSRTLPGDPLAKSAPRPASLGHMLGNRDFVLYIVCTESEAVLKLTGQKFSVEGTLLEHAQSAQALAETIEKAIARRQRSLRPGEPPYRPILRFQVHPGGLRSYYRIYPALENLRIPMQRENVEP